MGRKLGPALRRELENLDKDADSRKAAMKNLKTYVKDLDSKAIPLFLAQVSETKEQGSSRGEYTISLYEVLARVHGRNIVPQIPNIMASVIRTLSSSASSFPLHRACSKVVPAIARYGIEPATPQEEKTAIIASLCRPLCDALMGSGGGRCSSENLASGAALCLKALVESDNWRFASAEMVNELCLKTAGALEEIPAQANAHMGLVMALSKHNALIIEAYARSLLRSGLHAVEAGVEDGNSQKRFSAIQMVNFLMKCVDSRSLTSELGKVMDVMERCNADPMPFVQGAAYETLMTAKAIAGQKSPRCEVASCSPFRRERSFRDVIVSPESQTAESFLHCVSLAESPLSTDQSSCQLEPAPRANRRLWNNDGSSGGVDVSLRDGIFWGNGNGIGRYIHQPDDSDCLCEMGNGGNFSGFGESPPTATLSERDASPTPSNRIRRPQSPFNIDVNIFTTPRKLLRSLQDSVDTSKQDLQNGRFRAFGNHAPCDLTAEAKEDSSSQNMGCNAAKDLNKQDPCKHDRSDGEELSSDCSESASSSGVVPSNSVAVLSESCQTCLAAKKNDTRIPQQAVGTKSKWVTVGISLVFGLSMILPAAVVAILRTGGDDNTFDLVPT